METQWFPAEYVGKVLKRNDYRQLRRSNGCIHYKKNLQFNNVHVIFTKRPDGLLELKNAHYEDSFHESRQSAKLEETIMRMLLDSL